MFQLKHLVTILFLLMTYSGLLGQKEIIIDNETASIELVNSTDQTSLQLLGGNPPFSDPSFQLISDNIIKLRGSISDFDGGYLFMRDAGNRITAELYGDRDPGTGVEENYGYLRLVGDSDPQIFPELVPGAFIPFIRLDNDIENQIWDIGIQGVNRGFFPNITSATELIFRYGFGPVASIDENGMYNQISDKRKKHNIQKLGSVLDKLLRIESATYCYLSESDDCNHIGFIAQNVQMEFPSLVSSRKIGDEESLMMHYSGMIPVTVKAIQEQQEIIERQQVQIDDQNALIATLIERLEALENQ